MANVTLPNSTYLDFTSYRSTSATTPEAAYDITPGEIHHTDSGLVVALVLDRANDPSTLLSGDWASRQKAIASLNAQGTLWSTYGADPAEYQKVLDGLHTMGVTVVGDAMGTSGYVTSAESRTIWVQLDTNTFPALFGTPLLRVGPTDDASQLFWNGSLSLPQEWKVSGIYPDFEAYPAVSNLAGTASVELPQGPQSPGNSSTANPAFYAQELGQNFYNFPEEWANQKTGTVGLLEPGVGDSLPFGSTQTFQDLLNAFRQGAGLDTDGHYYVVAPAGQLYDNSAGERSLDVGVVTSAAPQSTIGLYVGSGLLNYSWATSYTAYQQAFWDLLHNPAVISSSFGDEVFPAPGSPFMAASRELFVDAALRNISVFSANGDGGSGDQTANGITNQYTSYTSPYGVLVGGTSLSPPAKAAADATLAQIVAEVASGNTATIWQLVSGGMTQLPDSTSQDTTQIETVWNSYVLRENHINPGYYINNAGSGGADPTQPTPWYQLAYGLTPFTADPLHQPGRGTPDVSAQAGGGVSYLVPSADMTEVWYDYGTSAATPFWASIAAHINAEFADIGLPQLGYANDLLYIAAVISPAAFNDITVGQNTSTFIEGGSYTTPNYSGDVIHVTPTGFGDSAGPGYDLATGLGTPNATVLARTLAAIATAQYYFDTPDVLTASGSTWSSTTDQSLLFQSALSADAPINLSLGGHDVSFNGAAGGAFAWTSQFAQQSLSADFSADLVTMFDKQAQGTVSQFHLAAGAGIGVQIGGATTGTPQASLSTPYGFVDFVSDATDSAVQVARAVAVAETAGAANDQEAVVRLRQSGNDAVSLLFYKVDDFSGTIDGIAPGQVGYDAATLAHAYATTSGGAWINGPGFGLYGQTALLDVDAGDIIAMRLKDGTHDYFAFSSANEQVNGEGVAHLWNYGLNTWGWEDLYGGGDHDYNDLVVQLDFTSAAGHGWLV
ncbi:DUF4114 domain-containing protein [Xanthobacter sp. VNH20]|uniref:DUF4114 domain-containing protein n=1 Tax=Xanthobacter sp. VNH20 TaxID=3156616 RepID=UPI0032B35730